jgi:Ca2+-binding RTX toxin-like protein
MGVLACALVLIPASNAFAGQVDVFGQTVNFSASNGETNNIVVEGSRGSVTIRDTAGGPVTDDTAFTGAPYFDGGFDDPSCNQDNASQVTCTPPAGAFFTEFSHVQVNLADLNDTATMGGSLDNMSFGVNGGDGNDNVSAGLGFANDINGENGDDTVTGGRFQDFLTGDLGNDVVSGGIGADFASGGIGNDNVQGDAGNDSVQGNEGDDTVGGGAGDDGVSGGDGNDLVNGGDGDDNVNGGRGVDTVQGDAGDDQVTATEDQVADTYGGGPGNDAIDYSNYAGGVALSLDGAANDGTAARTARYAPRQAVAAENDAVDATFENGFTGEGDDTVTGNDQFNVLSSNGGNDAVSGLGGDDSLFGGQGTDTLNGGEGRDFLGGGTDNDVLNGDNGDDDLTGNSGSDTFNGGGGVDTADYQGQGANLVITLDRAANDGAQNELDNADADGSVENAIGGFGDDSITGNVAVNFLDGNAGNDQINARDGTFLTDIVACGTGYDVAAADALDSVDKSDVNRCESAPDFPITRVKPTLTAKVSPKTNRKFPKTFTVSGKLTTGAVPAGAACQSDSFVAIQTKRGKNTISTRRVSLSATCTYSAIISFTDRKRLGTSKKLTFRVIFSGNRFLTTASKSTTATIR